MGELSIANLMGWLQGGGSFLQSWGLMESGKAARLQGERAQAAAEFEAMQAERDAGTAVAIAQRQAAEERRQAGLQASRALAVAAASGGGVSDPTIVNLIAATRGEGARRAAVALYEGEAKARKLRLEAAATRVSGADALAEGSARRQGYNLAALGATVRGYGAYEARSLYEKYGRGGPPKGDGALIAEPTMYG